uniref:Sulfotransferase n=1 Tax=Jaculus jaculus TaxID=51337 RepID=A0A8C5KI79_JACJA|nr:carbohydrate sulfotransferase 7 [Jaculus jaculus]
MKGRRRRRGEYCKFALLLVLYTLMLMLIPSVLDGGRDEDEGHCPDMQRSLGVWSLEAAAAGEREQGVEAQPAVEWGAGTSLRSPGDVRTHEKQHIYVHATWRTGSSFLGELFNQHPDVFYLYEPMWHVWQALYPGDAESLQGALRDMLRSLFRCDFSVLGLYMPPGGPAARASDLANVTTATLFRWRTNKVICSPPLCPDAPRARSEVGLVEDSVCERSCPPVPLRALEAECRKYPVVVIKDVRLLDLGVLVPLLRDPGLNLKVVQLFRDPRAVHNSRLKSRQGLLRESIQVLRARQRGGGFHRMLLGHVMGPRPGSQSRAMPSAPRPDLFLNRALEVICEAWLRDLLFTSGAPAWLQRRYLQLRYEDLVWHPESQLRRLLQFSGLRALDELEAFALNMTRGSAYGADRPFHLSARDAREAVHAWRERLSQEQVRQVEVACAPAMRLLAYPLSGEEGNAGEPPLEMQAKGVMNQLYP